jgi:hypothetical protein
LGCILGELLRGQPLFPAASEAECLQMHCQLLGTPTPRIWPVSAAYYCAAACCAVTQSTAMQMHCQLLLAPTPRIWPVSGGASVCRAFSFYNICVMHLPAALSPQASCFVSSAAASSQCTLCCAAGCCAVAPSTALHM